MSYLPPNTPYAPTNPMLLPQPGLGGQNPMNPMASLPMPGGSGFPNMALPGVPQPAMSPGMPAGLSQDAFGPPMSAPAAGSPQGTVFQHPSGGYADNNTNLSGGSFWSSGKGISAIVAGIAVAIYAGIAISKGQLNIFKGASSEYGSKGLHELTGDLKTAADELVKKLQSAKTALSKSTDVTKENVDTKITELKAPFKELKDNNLKSEVTETDYKVFDNYEKAYTAYADKIAEGVKADKPLADVLGSGEVKALEAAIQPAEEAFTKKLTAPPKAAELEAGSAGAQGANGAGAQGANGAGAQGANGAGAQGANGAGAQGANGAGAQTAAAPEKKGLLASIFNSIKNSLPNNPLKRAPKPQAVPSETTAAATATTGS